MIFADILRRERNRLAVLIKDWRRYRRALDAKDSSYLALCNRNERLESAPDGSGFRCDWKWTSDLHAPKYLRSLGVDLMRRALDDNPFSRAPAPEKQSQNPEVSFIIGHRGMDRLPHLLATLESIAGQRSATVECIVVEQDTVSRIAAHLPPWVRHVHTPPPSPEMAYCRSWTFNLGAKHGLGEVLVLHDNDMLVPVDYATSILKHVRSGYDLVNLKRFVFYLDQHHTAAVFAGEAGLFERPPLCVVQNLEGGGSVAITRKAYEQIGGMDESFIGWGGEDNEFWERGQTLRVWPYAYLPIVHLWHAAQPGKQQEKSATAIHYNRLSALPVQARIEQLRATPGGQMEGPTGWIG